MGLVSQHGSVGREGPFPCCGTVCLSCLVTVMFSQRQGFGMNSNCGKYQQAIAGDVAVVSVAGPIIPESSETNWDVAWVGDVLR